MTIMKRMVRHITLICLLAALMVPLAPREGRSSVCICACAFPAARITIALIDQEHDQTRAYFGTALPIAPPPGTIAGNGSGRMGQHEDWLIRELFKARLLPAMQYMTEHLSGLMMHQMLITGSFFDAKDQLESQLMMQEMNAAAYRDYQPNVTMCEFGTAGRSLAQSSRIARTNAFAMNRQYMLRALGNRGNNAGEGPDSDRGGKEGPLSGRLGQFRKNFCDFHDLNRIPNGATTGLFFCEDIAGGTPGNQAIAKGVVNRDIDFNRTVMMPRIISADLTDKQLDPYSTDNGAIQAMANNLYGHDVFRRDKISEYINTNDEYMDSRSITAKRSVAQSSFNDIVSMKMRGSSDQPANPGAPPANGAAAGSSTDTGSYLKVILKQLGGGTPGGQWDPDALQGGANEDDSFNNYLTGMKKAGTDYNPTGQMSYFGEMEFIAKKFYQRPEFYTNLYTNPQNLKRQSVAMQAVNLMLDRNIYESDLRSEMLLSMVLEMRLRPLQAEVENNLAKLDRGSTAK